MSIIITTTTSTTSTSITSPSTISTADGETEKPTCNQMTVATTDSKRDSSSSSRPSSVTSEPEANFNALDAKETTEPSSSEDSSTAAESASALSEGGLGLDSEKAVEEQPTEATDGPVTSAVPSPSTASGSMSTTADETKTSIDNEITVPAVDSKQDSSSSSRPSSATSEQEPKQTALDVKETNEPTSADLASASLISKSTLVLDSKKEAEELPTVVTDEHATSAGPLPSSTASLTPVSRKSHTPPSPHANHTAHSARSLFSPSKNGDVPPLPEDATSIWPLYHSAQIKPPINEHKSTPISLKRYSSGDLEPESKRLKDPHHSSPSAASLGPKTGSMYGNYLGNGADAVPSSPSASSSLSSLSQLSQSIGGTINNQKERESALAAASNSKNSTSLPKSKDVSIKWGSNNPYMPLGVNTAPSSRSITPSPNSASLSSGIRPPLSLYPPPPMTPSSLALDPLLAHNNADLLRRELDSRFLASQDRTMKIPPPPYMRNDLSSLYGLPFSQMATNMQLYEKYAKESLAGRNPFGPMGTLPPGYPTHLSPSPGAPPIPASIAPSPVSNTVPADRAYANANPFSISNHVAAFQPKSNSQLSDHSKNSKKSGRWCAMHVRIAWEIYQRQQKSPHQDKLAINSLTNSNKLPNNERPRDHDRDRERERDVAKSKETNGSPNLSHKVPTSTSSLNNESIRPTQTFYPGLRPHEMPSFSASLLSAAAGHLPPPGPPTPGNPFGDPLSAAAHSNLMGMSHYRPPPFGAAIPPYPSPGLLAAGLGGFPPGMSRDLGLYAAAAAAAMPYGADPWRCAPPLAPRPPLVGPPPPPLTGSSAPAPGASGSPSASPWGGLAKNGSDPSSSRPPVASVPQSPQNLQNLSESEKRELARRMETGRMLQPPVPLSAASMRDLAMFQILH